MSEEDAKHVSGSQTTPPYVGEVGALRRSINALKWRHRHKYDILLKKIDGANWNQRRYKEIMKSVEIHREKFQQLDDKYLKMYNLLEGDINTKQDYQVEWKQLIEDNEKLEELLDKELDDYTPQEDTGGGDDFIFIRNFDYCG